MGEGMGELGTYMDDLLPLIIEHGLSLLGAVVILFAGWALANWAARKVRGRLTTSERFDETLIPVIGQSVRVMVLVVTILAVLGQFGIQTASIIAVLGAAGLAVGLALQGTLSNVASGMMLLILRPFKVGDVVDISGTLGIVDEIGLFTTEMHSFDNLGIVMPNTQVWGSKIVNYTKFDTRRVDLEFGISYGDDMDKAMKLIKEVLDADERILAEPEPLLAVATLGDSSVGIRVRPWAKTPDVWPLRYDLTKKVKESFDQNGISIPFPQRDVHLIQEKSSLGI
ncbi:MAG: mechanosensitive ion channel domain-containing protein [Balneolaceae bacterium]